MTEINNTVIAEKHGSIWPGAHGLAIYFPANSGSFDSAYNGSLIAFAKDTQWDESLQAFYDFMIGSWIATARNSSQDFYTPEHIELYHFCQLLQ